MSGRGTALTVAGIGLLLVGLIGLAAGRIYGQAHAFATVADQKVDCGTVFAPDPTADAGADTGGFLGQSSPHPCADTLSTRRTTVHRLVWGGGALAVLAVARMLVPGLAVRAGRERDA